MSTRHINPAGVHRSPAFSQAVVVEQVWDPADPPPAITVHVVSALGPGFLVEIDAVAAI